MKLKKILKWLLLVTIIVVIIFFLVGIYFPNLIIISNSFQEPIPIVISKDLQNLIDAESQNDVSTEQSNVNLPVHLIIPLINVDAFVEYLGITSDGTMDAPKGPDDVAWFDLGPRPGEKGSAVIAGHYGWKNNVPAVFDNLNKLKIGDKIYVTDDRGATTTFVVNEIGIYSQNGDATNTFSSNDGKAHLNLITCEGVWNAVLKSRPNRLVVFTSKE
jgi:LPXTG-site transpeptidase (sortase) family protein